MLKSECRNKQEDLTGYCSYISHLFEFVSIKLFVISALPLIMYLTIFKLPFEIFYLHLLPKTYIPSLQVTLSTITSAIWALNSQYFVFGNQNCVRAKQTRFGGMFCTRTGLNAKSRIMVVQPPYCTGRLVFYYIIGGHTNRWCAITRKMMLSRFLAPWINATIWH